MLTGLSKVRKNVKTDGGGSLPWVNDRLTKGYTLGENSLPLPAANITADHSMTTSRVVYSTPHSILEFGLA